MGGSASCWLKPGQFSDSFFCYIHLLRAPVLLLSWGLAESLSCPCSSPGFGSLQDQKLFLEDGGWKLVDAVAQYWCSRMVWSEEEQCYHIKGTSAEARSPPALQTPALWNSSQVTFVPVQTQCKMLSSLPMPQYQLFLISAPCHSWDTSKCLLPWWYKLMPQA